MPTILVQTYLIAAKDTKVFFKDRFAVGFAFLFPFLFVVGFTLALGDIGPGDHRLELAIATQESSGISNQLIDRIRDSGQAVILVDYESALSDVENGTLDGLIAFPSDFTQSISNGSPTAIEVVVASGASPGTEAALRGSAELIAARLTDVVVTVSTLFRLSPPISGGLPAFDATSALSMNAHTLTFEVVTVGEVEPLNASNFTLPGYLTMFVFFVAAMSADTITRERQGQTLERLRSNGGRREAIILGKFAGIAFRGMLQLAVMWAVGILAFRIDLGISPTAVILVSMLLALASAAFGVMLASFVSTVQTASAAGVLASLILAPLGGCWWPLFIAPEWMQSLAKLTPHGWANTGFNKLMLFGAEFADVSQEMIALIVFGALFLAVAFWRFRTSAG